MRRALAPIGLFLLALAVRALPATSVFAEGRVYFRGNDPYYHLRRIFYSIENFPAALDFDPYVAFPTGAKPIWPVAFDWLLALLLWPVQRLGGAGAVEVAGAWLPPLLGAATVVSTWFLVRRHFGSRAALIAGALLSILGGHFLFSQVGALDHHVASSLATTSLLLVAMGRLAADAERRAGRRAAGLGLLLAACLLIWPGSLLEVSLTLAGLSLHALWRPGATAELRRLALALAVAALAVAPFSLGNDWPQWNAYSPTVLSNFQPWLFATGLIACLACAELLRHERLGGGRAARLTTGAAVTLWLLGLSLWLLPDLFAGSADAWRWLAKREVFQASVVESNPLLVDRGAFSTVMATQRLSALLYVYPLLWLGSLAELRLVRWSPARAFFLAWSLSLFGVTLVQTRFLASFSVAFCVQLAWSFESGARLLHDRVRDPRRRRFAAALAGAALLAALLPLGGSYVRPLLNLGRALRGQPIDLWREQAAGRIVYSSALWARANTPTTAGWLDASVRPAYGVLAPWWIGHLFRYGAQRPMVTDNFGDDVGERNFALERRFWESPQAEANGILERLEVRYVVAQLGGDPRAEAYAPDSMRSALTGRRGADILDAPGSAQQVPGLERLRLVFESRPLFSGSEKPPLIKIYEFVPGARIVGRSAPGSLVRLELALRELGRRRLDYRTQTHASKDGRYSFRVPYANGPGLGTLSAGGYYRLSCGNVRGRVRVAERQVLHGAELPGPDLCP